MKVDHFLFNFDAHFCTSTTYFIGYCDVYVKNCEKLCESRETKQNVR
jgi:hypothetical protein